MAPTAQPAAEDPTRHLPRILCLHGGGVNADVFRLQCRGLISRLSASFRLVFADAPFICPPHPAVASVYGDHGPFRRWLRWLPEHRAVDAETASEEIRFQLRTAIADDDAQGATGPWVALLGFSQGAKIVASLLLAQQTVEGRRKNNSAEEELGGGALDAVRWRFGVVMAGRAPMVSLDQRMGYIKGVQDASGIGAEFTDWPDREAGKRGRHVLRIPTVHVHGLRDAGLGLHRRLLEEYCDPETVRLVEWDGDHRIPIKGPDVQAVVDEILRAAGETRVATNK